MTQAAMRQAAAFLRYLLRIVAPAIVLTLSGLALLLLQYAHDVRRHNEVIHAKALNAANDFRDALREAGQSQDIRNQALSAFLSAPLESFAVRPHGAFVWEPKKKIAWHRNLEPELEKILSARQYWKDWSLPGKKTLQERGVETFETESAAVHVLWGRVDGCMYGLVFDTFPVRDDSRTWLWLAGGGFLLALAAFLVYAAVQLWRAAEKARRDDALKTRFVSDVSHELKTPLAAMGLWADMLTGGHLADESRKKHALAVIAEEKGRMLRLVDTLLDFTRLEQGRRVYTMEPVDIGAMARDIVELLRGDFGEHGISVTAADGCMARADFDAVKGIFVNLLGNAAKYAASYGPVEVTVHREGGKVLATVSDVGPGISPKDRDKVFDRFYRSGDDAAVGKGGFGLGLPISRRLARDMGGDLTFSDRPGGGAIFTLSLNCVEGV